LPQAKQNSGWPFRQEAFPLPSPLPEELPGEDFPQDKIYKLSLVQEKNKPPLKKEPRKSSQKKKLLA
jgi:hypothetical protein